MEADAAGLGQLMFDAIRKGTARHYTAAQRKAWAPEPRLGQTWTQRLATPTTFVAEDAQGLAGFMTLAADGYIDLAYVRPDRIGGGVAAQLYRVLEQQAQANDVACLYSEASDLARPFFARHGWELIESQEVLANGVVLRNHKMQKRLC